MSSNLLPNRVPFQICVPLGATGIGSSCTRGSLPYPGAAGVGLVPAGKAGGAPNKTTPTLLVMGVVFLCRFVSFAFVNAFFENPMRWDAYGQTALCPNAPSSLVGFFWMFAFLN